MRVTTQNLLSSTSPSTYFSSSVSPYSIEISQQVLITLDPLLQRSSNPSSLLNQSVTPNASLTTSIPYSSLPLSFGNQKKRGFSVSLVEGGRTRRRVTSNLLKIHAAAAAGIRRRPLAGRPRSGESNCAGSYGSTGERSGLAQRG